MAKRIPIVTHPDARLRQKTADVPLSRISDPAFQALLEDMTKTMIEADGIGLAAIQIGEPSNIAVVNLDDGPMHLINSRIVFYSKTKDLDVEACLSVPGIAGRVRRSTQINIDAFDRHGVAISFTATGYFARVLQHEIDHLNGILYIDRAEEIWEDIKKKKK